MPAFRPGGAGGEAPALLRLTVPPRARRSRRLVAMPGGRRATVDANSGHPHVPYLPCDLTRYFLRYFTRCYAVAARQGQRRGIRKGAARPAGRLVLVLIRNSARKRT